MAEHAADPGVREPLDLLLHAPGRDPGGGRLQSEGHARRGGRRRRRIRLRQVDRGSGDHVLPRQERPDREGLAALHGPRHDQDERGGAAPAARLQDRHGLPGADGLAEPGAADRQAADGGPALPRAGDRGRGLRAGEEDPGRGEAARPAADHEFLPAPDLGRPAAARGDRHGAAVESGAA